MDNSDPWEPDNAKFAYARTSAKARVADYWSRWQYNMWTEYHTALNPDWVDPWFEHEIGGITNDPPESSEDLTGYQMLQNLYCSYCWFKWHGYNKYAMVGMMTGFTHESTVTGGSWEARVYPYRTLTEFDPTNIANPLSDSSTRIWYYNGAIVPAVTRHQTDEVTGIPYTLTAPAGSLLAARAYPMLTYEVEVEETDPETGEPVIDPDTGEPVMVRKTRVTLDEHGNPMWDTEHPQGPVKGAGTGYGIIQFTPFTKLPHISATAAMDSTYSDRNQFYEANRHWQLNLTLQYMIFEYQRYCAMNKDQTATNYVGEWTDGGGNNAGFDYNGVHYLFNEPVTWDQFASAAWLPKTNALINQLGLTGEDADWCRRRMAMDIWRACYVHSPYNDFNFQVISRYIMAAIDYWDSLNDTGYINDIPRPRDIPYCDLDYYHITPVSFPLFMRKRKRININHINV